MRLFCPFASRVGRFARFSFVTVFENDSIAMMGGALQSGRVGGGGAATRPIARGYCTRAVDGPGATQRDSRHIHNSLNRASSFPFPHFPSLLFSAVACRCES